MYWNSMLASTGHGCLHRLATLWHGAGGYDLHRLRIWLRSDDWIYISILYSCVICECNLPCSFPPAHIRVEFVECPVREIVKYVDIYIELLEEDG